jgi:S1-C subfamily serine protease
VRSVVTLLLAVSLLAAPSFAGYSNLTLSIRPIQNQTITDLGVVTFRNTCTTTSIDSDRHYWLTAAHCVGDSELFIAGHSASVVFIDKAADLAVLYTPNYSLPSLKLRPTRPSVEQAVMIVGHPVGLPQVQVFRGHISSRRTWVDDAWFMTFDMPACGGNSGAAVVDSNDQVVSVLQIGWGPGCSPFSAGAPWEVLARLVGKYFKS